MKGNPTYGPLYHMGEHMRDSRGKTCVRWLIPFGYGHLLPKEVREAAERYNKALAEVVDARAAFRTALALAEPKV